MKHNPLLVFIHVAIHLEYVSVELPLFSVIWSVTNHSTMCTPQHVNHTRGWVARPQLFTAYHPQRQSLFSFLFVCLYRGNFPLPLLLKLVFQRMGVPSVMVLPLLVVVIAGIYYVYNEVIRFMSKSVVRNKVVVITDAVSGMGSGNTLTDSIFNWFYAVISTHQYCPVSVQASCFYGFHWLIDVAMQFCASVHHADCSKTLKPTHTVQKWGLL